MKIQIILFSLILLTLNCLKATKSAFDVNNGSSMSGILVVSDLFGIQSYDTSATPSLQKSYSSGVFTLTWNPIPGANDYKIFYKTSSGVSESDSFVNTGNVTTYSFVGLPINVYFFKIKAISGETEGLLSDEVMLSPIETPVLSGNAGSNNVFLTWTGSGNDKTFYIYYKTSPGVTIADTKLTLSLSFGMTFSFINNLSPNQTYYFRIISHDNNFNLDSELSEEFSVSTTSFVSYYIFISPDLIFNGGGGGTLSGLNKPFVAFKDEYCTLNKGSLTGAFKALVGASTRNPTNDWPLKPNTAYKRPDGTIIGITDNNAKFNTNDASYLGIDPSFPKVWTGLTNTMDADTSNNCGDWSGSYSSYFSNYGFQDAQHDFYFDAMACNTSAHIYCVQQ